MQSVPGRGALRVVCCLLAIVLTGACSDDTTVAPDAGLQGDLTAVDAQWTDSATDAKAADAATTDSVPPDAAMDGTTPDAPTPDAPTSDAPTPDAPTPDATTPDATTPDAPPFDAASPDAQLSDASVADLAPDAATQESLCADGKDNDGDTLTDCADPDCNWHPCRAPAGVCDAVEHCTSGVCPPDGFRYNTVCRAGDTCDPEETCSGTSPTCPPDKLSPVTKVCRASTGPCDQAESCDGKSAICPLDLYHDATKACRASTGACDPAESCDAASAACPKDKLASSTTACRPKAGLCDVEELCDGVSATCGSDVVLAQGVSCRASVGGCDSAESCSGTAGTCPPDNTSCLAGNYCDGSTCQPKLTQGQACSSSAQCLSGQCWDGVCCDAYCAGVCRGCKTAGKVGTCVLYAADTDPENECGAYTCYFSPTWKTTFCRKVCTANSNCKSTLYCDGGSHCAPKLANGGTCNEDSDCTSNKCWKTLGKPGWADGVCCDKTDCSNCCSDCSTGTCKHQANYSEPPSTLYCGRYTCDGKGKLYTACVADAFNCSWHCNKYSWCWAGKCEADLGSGAPCLGSCQCQSNFCFFFRC